MNQLHKFLTEAREAVAHWEPPVCDMIDPLDKALKLVEGGEVLSWDGAGTMSVALDDGRLRVDKVFHGPCLVIPLPPAVEVSERHREWARNMILAGNAARDITDGQVTTSGVVEAAARKLAELEGER